MRGELPRFSRKAGMTRRSWLRRGVALTVQLVLFVIVGALVQSAPAYAHDQIISHTPTAGERVDAAPDAITLTLSSVPLDVGATIVVVDREQKEWNEGSPQYNGTEIVQDLAENMPEGAYEVRWRVVSGDGHPLRDSFRFLVGINTSSELLTTSFADGAGTAAAGSADDHSMSAARSPVSPTAVLIVGSAALLGLALILVGRRRIARPLARSSAKLNRVEKRIE